MGAIGILCLVAFVIICVLLVLLVLVQEEDNSGMGGLLGGGNSAAFGAHQASVLTKATVVLAVLFFLVTFALAKILPKKTSTLEADLQAQAVEEGKAVEESNSTESSSADWWKNDQAANEATETAPVEATPETTSAAN